MLVPDMKVNRVSDINMNALAERGIDTLIVDIDNTLVPWYSIEVPRDIALWVEAAKSRFKLCAVSNTVYRRAQAVTQQLGIQFVHGACKPSTRGLKRALSMLGASAESAAFIGDQLFTDVLAAKRMGMFAILVKPLTNIEMPHSYLMRLLEKLIMAVVKLQQKNMRKGA